MYRALSRIHYKDSDGAIVVFDLTYRDSFNDVLEWVEDLRDNSSEDIQILLLGNKLDLVQEDPKNRKVEYEEAMTLVNKKLEHCTYFEVSALSSENVQEAINTFVGRICKKKKDIRASMRNSKVRLNDVNNVPKGEGKSRNNGENKKNQSGCC